MSVSRMDINVFFLENRFDIDILQIRLASIYFLQRHRRKKISNSPGTTKNYVFV